MKSQIKKYIYLVISIFIILIISVGCSKNNTSNEQKDTVVKEEGKEDKNNDKDSEESKDKDEDINKEDDMNDNKDNNDDPLDIPDKDKKSEKDPIQISPPQLRPEPEPQPEVTPKPQPKPKPEKPQDVIIIYPGQKLKLPSSGQAIALEPAKVVKSGIKSTANKQIALTFDAGWIYEPTIDILNVLDKYNVKSTFFLRGYWVRDHSDLAIEIIKRGHKIENHSLTHPHMKQMSEAQIRNEIKETTRIIKKVTNTNPYLFRPPFGEYDKRVLKILGEENYSYAVMWTIDTHDWADEINGNKVTTQYVIDRVLNNASHKGIVLMHIGKQKTVEALPQIITGLKDRGYTLTTANAMLEKTTNTTNSSNIYTVKKGDTLYAIAKKYNTTVEELIKLNRLK